MMIGYNPKAGAMTHGQRDLPKGFEPGLVKFPNTQDGKDAGAIEYVYALMARAAGIEMTETHLLPAKRGAGFFATRRFDRIGKNRLHAHTASGLLHADHRTPSLEYEDLIALTLRLTRDVREAEKMFRLAVFNVLGHSRDDHAKNFTFLMDEAGNWSLSLLMISPSPPALAASRPRWSKVKAKPQARRICSLSRKRQASSQRMPKRSSTRPARRSTNGHTLPKSMTWQPPVSD